jgi:hypothetical protein
MVKKIALRFFVGREKLFGEIAGPQVSVNSDSFLVCVGSTRIFRFEGQTNESSALASNRRLPIGFGRMFHITDAEHEIMLPCIAVSMFS